MVKNPINKLLAGVLYNSYKLTVCITFLYFIQLNEIKGFLLFVSQSLHLMIGMRSVVATTVRVSINVTILTDYRSPASSDQ